MVYHHTDKIIRLARQYLDGAWLNSPLTANVNLKDTCNAHWDGQTINFYSADSQCANTGLISDVIYHDGAMDWTSLTAVSPTVRTQKDLAILCRLSSRIILSWQTDFL